MPSEPKRIAITGVSRGLGRAMVEGFIDRGHTILGCCRSTDAVAELRAAHPDPHDFQSVDVSDDEQVARWGEHVLSLGSVPDLLINNAALINRNAPLWEVPAEEFSRLIDVNIKGVAAVIRHLVPAMIERGRGVIVNISSGWGRSTAPEVGPYCTSKWAIEGLSRALAQELPEGLVAVPLNPGIIHTAMLETCFGEAAAGYPDPTEWAERAVPMMLELGPEHNGQPLSVGG